MFGAVWMDPRLYAYEALMADDAAWYAAKVAHQFDDNTPPAPAPTREEEEERRRKFARNMAETLFVAGMLVASPQGAAGSAVLFP